MNGDKPARYRSLIGLIICIWLIHNSYGQSLPDSFNKLAPSKEWLEQMESAGIKKETILHSPVDSVHVHAYFMVWLKHMENNAYPFADIALTSDSLKHLRIVYHNGPQIRIDTLVVKGENPPKKEYLEGMLQFCKGIQYQQKWIESIPERIAADGNYLCEQPPEIEFLQKKARVYIYPTSIARNQVMLLAGFQSDANGHHRLTGEADLKLYNIFQRGIELETQWKSPSQMEQMLDLKIVYPYLLFKHLGVKGSYSLHRRDSTSILQEWRLGLLFPRTEKGQWEIQLRNRIAREQSANGSSNAWFYGMGYTTKQWFCTGEIGVHTGQNKHSFAAGVKAGSTDEWSLSHWSELYLKSRFEWNYIRGNEWSITEVPYWGGSSSLRGFQDLSLAGNSFAGIQADYHIILDAYIQIPIFMDIAVLENQKKWHGYDGWGTGIFIVRKQGNIALYYALGQKWGDPLDWKAYKIHITYAHRF